MKKALIILLLMTSLGFSMLSNYPPLECLGGKFVTLDFLNQRVYVLDDEGRILERNPLSAGQFSQLRSNWTLSTVQSLGLQIVLHPITRSNYQTIRVNDDGLGLTLQSAGINMTSMTGRTYQPGPMLSSANIPANLDCLQQIVVNETLSLPSKISASGKVFVRASEVHLKDGFNAARGSEVRILAQ